MNIKSFAVDMDGVVADWVKRMLQEFPHLATQDQLNKIPNREEQIRAVYEKHPHLFRELELMPWAVDLMEMLRRTGLPIIFLSAAGTAHPSTSTVRIDKNWWFENVLRPSIGFDVPVTVVADSDCKIDEMQDGMCLIDDFHRNIALWKEASGVGFVLDSWDDFYNIETTLLKLGILKCANSGLTLPLSC